MIQFWDQAKIFQGPDPANCLLMRCITVETSAQYCNSRTRVNFRLVFYGFEEEQGRSFAVGSEEGELLLMNLSAGGPHKLGHRPSL
jgi:hypothetical protein